MNINTLTSLVPYNHEKFLEFLEEDYNKFLLLHKLKHSKTNQIIYLEVCIRDYIPRLIENVINEFTEINEKLIRENEKLALAIMNNKNGKICRLN